MGIIKKLDPELVMRIAAGEVIERPASIVKELIENSIDAGANRINMELSNGGLTHIKITDNGIGISSEDVPLLLDRHVTSKIHDFVDLENVGTLGFRGEALYSIASVSKFILSSRNRGEEAGSELSYIDRTKKIRTIAHPVGTSIEADGIFYNTPARRKFLKSSSSEYARCAEIVTKFSLAYPLIAFELTHAGRLNLQTTGGGIQDALLAVFGKTDARNFIPISTRDQRVGIRGQIADPGLVRSTRKDQTFTINGRIIYDIAMNLALERAFSRLIAEGKKPLCVIDVTIDPGSIDVNVHPHKREVRLAAPRAAYDAIQRACSEALKRELSGFQAAQPQTEPLADEIENQPIPGAKSSISDDPHGFVTFEKRDSDRKNLGELLGEVEMRGRGQFTKGIQGTPELTVHRTVDPGGVPDVLEDLLDIEEGDIIQFLDTYLILNRGDILYLIDQHNLHETLLYREMKGLDNRTTVSQKLLFPVPIEFTPEIRSVIEEKSELKNIAF